MPSAGPSRASVLVTMKACWPRNQPPDAVLVDGILSKLAIVDVDVGVLRIPALHVVSNHVPLLLQWKDSDQESMVEWSTFEGPRIFSIWPALISLDSEQMLTVGFKVLV